MRRFLFLFIFIFSVSGYAQNRSFHMEYGIKKVLSLPAPVITDRWFGVDKGRHFVGSFILTGFTQQSLYRYSGRKRKESRKIAFGFSLSIGIGKEIWDSTKQNNHFSYKDLTADILGSLFAILIVGNL